MLLSHFKTTALIIQDLLRFKVKSMFYGGNVFHILKKKYIYIKGRRTSKNNLITAFIYVLENHVP